MEPGFRVGGVAVSEAVCVRLYFLTEITSGAGLSASWRECVGNVWPRAVRNGLCAVLGKFTFYMN